MEQQHELYNRKEIEPNSIMIADVMATALRLRDIVSLETRFLEQMDFQSLHTIQDEKEALVSRLEKQKKLVAYSPEVLSPYTAQEAIDMQQVVKDLERVMADNAMQLIKAKETNHKVVEAIASAVARQCNKSRGYSKEGKDGVAVNYKGNVVPPMQLNETI